MHGAPFSHTTGMSSTAAAGGCTALLPVAFQSAAVGRDRGSDNSRRPEPDRGASDAAQLADVTGGGGVTNTVKLRAYHGPAPAAATRLYVMLELSTPGGRRASAHDTADGVTVNTGPQA